MLNTSIKWTAVAVTVALSFTTSAAFAAGANSGGHGDGSIGSAGDAGHVDREIVIDMGEMYFLPSRIEIRKGETVRFIVNNVGEFVHEFNIATEAMHLDHSEEMVMMIDMGVLETDKINHQLMAASGMAHNDPNALLLEPGRSDLDIQRGCNAGTFLQCSRPSRERDVRANRDGELTTLS